MIARPVMVGLTATFVLLTTGCGSEKPADSPIRQPSPTRSVAASPESAGESAALAAYRGMWASFVEAATTSDPEFAGLREHAAGQALRLITSSLYTDHDQKRVTKGDLTLNPKVTLMKPPDAPTEVTIVDCVDSTKWLKYKVNGGLADDEPGGRHRNTATVKNTNGTWRVESFTLEESGTC
ncbi:hypothetical protein [Actinoplanes siamensis]|uniref:Secreted protein/lipoprotein n=1 Tax=Actinoplanes siamensis TaxID=1223317 RepID=A0A919TIR0_9ACTN|nr:hypothetical protein [Actinoplanes siamensis]GIF04641.1 hypothetical protein Asi03nite_21790 [Actinoplanes siamensis]